MSRYPGWPSPPSRWRRCSLPFCWRSVSSAFLAKKPLVQAELLALPAIGVVLCFAARRVIRNSEGTRTGENLANTAWWICVIAGLGYAAYLLAIDFAIRRDAKAELDAGWRT